MTPELNIARPLTATEEAILAQLAEAFFAEAVLRRLEATLQGASA
jgi:hypothetical protein